MSFILPQNRTGSVDEMREEGRDIHEIEWAASGLIGRRIIVAADIHLTCSEVS